MISLRFLLVLLAILCIALPRLVLGQTSFSFTLSSSARTSAGVYKSDGTLVKTLWSGVTYSAGTHKQTWDGSDDEGRLADNSAYTIKVLSNNVQYKWEGVIGNTSAKPTGSSVFRHYWFMTNMVTVGNIAYYSTSYNEGNPSQSSFNLTDPQKRIRIFEKSGSQDTDFLASDDVNMYWGGIDPYAYSKSFVFASRLADNTELSFLQGTPLKMTRGKGYSSAINLVTNTNGHISGMAVQKKGSYLFVARKGLNRIDVVNKTSGAVVQTIKKFTSPRALCIDNQGNLWVVHGVKSVQKFTVNRDGTLGAAIVTLSGLIQPLALGVSKDGTTLAVCDGGSSQQVKAYNNSTGASVWKLGEQGGYANNATVNNNKFYFSDARGPLRTFIAFANDGSFWVGDAGNYRTQHYSSNRTFLNRIMYMPHFYSAGIDRNNNTRVFADYLEFSIDYSKPLQPGNGSWTLVNNWGYNVPSSKDDKYHRLRSVNTLRNGRTYAIQFATNGKLEIVELVKGGNMRFTGIRLDDLYYLYPDGSLRRTTNRSIGNPTVFTKKVLTGFDSKHNPLWLSPQVIAQTPPVTAKDPIFWGNVNTYMPGEITSSNLIISFDGGKPPYGSSGYHLGAIKQGENKWLWRTAMSTHKDYNGEFPTDGAYDLGNGVRYAGSVQLVMERNIFWGYHGEFWKNGQTNKWNHVYDNGLFVGQFGVTGEEANGEAAFAMAGNAFAASLAKDNLGNVYLYHNDELTHSALHRWKVTGLNTIREQIIPVVLAVKAQQEGNGLLGQYFDGSNLNNFSIKTTRIDPLINFNWTSGIPSGTKLSNPDKFSVSWTGFVQPRYSQAYTFYTSTDDGVRLWVDGQLLIDRWQRQAATEYNASITLVGGKRYAIRMEYFELTDGASASLSWSSLSQAKQVIPSSRLFPAKAPDRSAGVDLLEGLPFNNVLENNLHGWSRTPVAEEYPDRYSKWWSVKTNIKSYNSFRSPDLYVYYRQASGKVYTVTRDLGNQNAASWKLSGKINWEGNYENTSGGGSYLEVLDGKGKIITRLYTSSINYNPATITLHANSKIIAKGLEASMKHVLERSQPVTIHVANGVATFSYGMYAPITVAILDQTSNWRSPKTMRLYFFTKEKNAARVINIERMRFSANTPNENTIANSPASTTTSSDTKTVMSKITNGNDDVEENQQGGMYINSTDIELVNDGSTTGNQVIGLRFLNLDIPKGALINNAYLQFTTNKTDSASTDIVIRGENIGNSPPFISANYNVSSRNKTSASISWFPAAWSKTGEKEASQRTPNLKAIIQQIVNHSGWATGNALTLIISGSGKRTAEAFEGSAFNAPTLMVEYIANTSSARYTSPEEELLFDDKEEVFLLNPNPFDDVIEVTFDNKLNGMQADIKFIDQLGKVHLSIDQILENGILEIDTRELRKGFYIFILSVEREKFIKKVVKE